MCKVLGLFLIGFFILPMAYAEDKLSGPNEWDFGKVKQEQALKHDFVFKNDTADILNIISVHTSCGCTASSADKKSLKPNESTQISVTFKTKNYLGEVKQYIYVNTDNTDSPVTKFIIKAQVAKGE